MSEESCGLDTGFALDTADNEHLSSILVWVAEYKGAFGLTVQFGGLEYAGKVAALSKLTRKAIKGSNHLILALELL